MSEMEIGLFDIMKLRHKISKILIIGNETLKDKIFTDLLLIYSYITRGLIFSKSKEYYKTKTGITTIYGEIDNELLNTYMRLQVNLLRKITENFTSNKLINRIDSLIIFDDMINCKMDGVNRLYMNGRNYRINSICYQSKLGIIKPEIRPQFNIVIYINDLQKIEDCNINEEYEEMKKINRNNLYVQFGEIFNSYDEMNKLLDRVFKTNDFLIIDSTILKETKLYFY